MPPKSKAVAPVATMSRATKTPTASKKATKAATAKPTATKKKPAAKSAKEASAAKANTSKKRQREADEEEEESEEDLEPKSKKTKRSAVAPKATKSKAAASKAKAAASSTKKTAKAKSVARSTTNAATVTKKTTSKRKASEPADAAPGPKKAKTAASKKSDESQDEGSDVESDDGAAAEIKAKAPATKKAGSKKATLPKKTVDPIMKVKIGAKINIAPTTPLDIFVFGEGSAGELGLGAKVVEKKRPIDVKRPRKNLLLSAPEVGVVQLACGGMHGLALTKDNKILSWGVNDQGALGRNTKWEGGLRDVDAPESESDDEDDDDTGLNPKESTPSEIDTSGIAPGTKFVQVAACDSASFALTEDGRVYGWGTFRSGDGVLGFSPTVHVQETPLLLPEPTKVVSIATGSNHVLTLDVKGKIQTWGAPEQNQLGRRVVVRDQKASALRAGGLAFKRGTTITKIACGSYHSFALDDQGRVWAFGLNNFGQLGLETEVGDDNACQLEPTLVTALAAHKITDVIGGEHHTLVLTDEGQVLVFGRIDGHQLGLPMEHFTADNSLYDEQDRVRILAVPTALAGLPKIVAADAGTDTSYVITEEGQVYSWGFNDNYQCGIGETIGDVLTPQLIDNSVVKDKKIVLAGAGGQFGMLASVQE